VPADLDERPGKTEAPRPHAERLAAEKAAAVAALHPASWVLAADTVVAVGRRIQPKAEDEATARACLALMSGRRHHVYTAVALVSPMGTVHRGTSESQIIFHRLSAADIDSLIAAGDWHGKAGGYALQGAAEAHIRWLAGSWSGVVGLPLAETRRLLLRTGYPLG
jgi:septum formation protein